MSQFMLTREQAARIANECDEREATEVLVTGEGGDLSVALVDEEGANLASFVLRPDGEKEEEER